LNKHHAFQRHDKDDQSEVYAVTRKTRGKTTDRAGYQDPFKDHMKKMEEKLQYGEAGSPAAKTYGGFADNTSMGTRSQAGYLSVQR
jgi:hypothetical protein